MPRARRRPARSARRQRAPRRRRPWPGRRARGRTLPSRTEHPPRAGRACRALAPRGRRGARRSSARARRRPSERRGGALARTIERRRPIRSESGPQSQTPTAMAITTAEIVSPAPAGPTWKSRPSSGRIACVEYIVANMPALPRRKPAMPRASRTRASIAARRRAIRCAGGNTVARSAIRPLTPTGGGG